MKSWSTDEKLDEGLELANDIEGEMAQWIIDNLIQTTNQCFECNVYLWRYVLFEKNKRQKNYTIPPFPQVLRLMEEWLIEWLVFFEQKV